MGWDSYIAVDWGTSNRRAYAIGPDGVCADMFEDELGVLAVPAGGFAAAVQAIRDRLGDRPMLLAGMVGSNRGWVETPYVACPAGMAALHQSIMWMEPDRVGIVPGVSVHRAQAPDVMRGEEVQVLGAVAAGLVPADCLICHPGTHAKWIRMGAAGIEGFQTRMTGELFALLKDHSILAPALQDDVKPDADFAHGVTDALSGIDLLAGLFSVRARVALGLAKGEAGYASGLLIGCDVRAALSGQDGLPLALVGRPELCRLYRAALLQSGRDAPEIDGADAFLAGIRVLVEMG